MNISLILFYFLMFYIFVTCTGCRPGPPSGPGPPMEFHPPGCAFVVYEMVLYH